MVEHFFDGSTQTYLNGSTLSSGLLTGPIYKFARAGSITHIRIWSNHVDTLACLSLEIVGFRQEKVYTISSTASGPFALGVGWTDVPLISAAIVGRDQCVAAAIRTTSGTQLALETVEGASWAGSANITRPQANTSLYTTTSGFGSLDPDATIIKRFDTVDVTFDPDNVPGAGFTLTEISDELARWLTTGGDKYAESDLPAIKGQAEGANTNAENAWTTAQQVQTDLGDFRDEWPGTLATALQGGLTTIGDWLSTESDWYKKLVHDTAPGAASLVDKVGDFTGITVFNYLADLIRWANGVNQQPQLADTTDWELLDETDFTDSLLWPVEADVYRVTLSSFDPAGTSEPVGTETRHAYLGKWCPFNVQFSSEWHYFNTESADLYLGGRMPGLGLILYRPGAGHVQAWRRAEAP